MTDGYEDPSNLDTVGIIRGYLPRHLAQVKDANNPDLDLVFRTVEEKQDTGDEDPLNYVEFELIGVVYDSDPFRNTLRERLGNDGVVFANIKGVFIVKWVSADVHDWAIKQWNLKSEAKIPLPPAKLAPFLTRLWHNRRSWKGLICFALAMLLYVTVLVGVNNPVPWEQANRTRDLVTLPIRTACWFVYERLTLLAERIAEESKEHVPPQPPNTHYKEKRPIEKEPPKTPHREPQRKKFFDDNGQLDPSTIAKLFEAHDLDAIVSTMEDGTKTIEGRGHDALILLRSLLAEEMKRTKSQSVDVEKKQCIDSPPLGTQRMFWRMLSDIPYQKWLVENDLEDMPLIKSPEERRAAADKVVFADDPSTTPLLERKFIAFTMSAIKEELYQNPEVDPNACGWSAIYATALQDQTTTPPTFFAWLLEQYWMYGVQALPTMGRLMTSETQEDFASFADNELARVGVTDTRLIGAPFKEFRP